MEKYKNAENAILELISDMLVGRVVSLMDELGYKIDKKGAENMVVNIGLHLAEKNKDIIRK